MSIYSIYFSPTQGTKVITNTLAQEIGTYQEIDLCEYTDQIQERIFSENDICLIGVPAYGGRVPRTATERIKGLKGNGALAVLVVSYGNRDYDDTLIELYDVVKAQGFTCVSGVTAIAEHSIMHQFASGRPDTDDINQLKTFAKEVKAKIDASRLTEVQVKGNRPYKELKEVPFHPTASDSCTMCGLCAKQCPVHAIPFEAPNQTNGEQCISCMRCVQVCPSKARHIDEQMLSAVSEKMKPLFAQRKENELFL
ncbi:MAG: EFR1 family ferrodoxin [Clostridium sp.]|nr:EFR1 family ferrodoxin [Clostridium sp.]